MIYVVLTEDFVAGLFDSYDLAQNFAEEMKQEGYDEAWIEEHTVNEYVVQDLSSEIQKLVDAGVIDYKVGEDGEFYFETTKEN